jgi:hypothetical protein
VHRGDSLNAALEEAAEDAVAVRCERRDVATHIIRDLNSATLAHALRHELANTFGRRIKLRLVKEAMAELHKFALARHPGCADVSDSNIDASSIIEPKLSPDQPSNLSAPLNSRRMPQKKCFVGALF